MLLNPCPFQVKQFSFHKGHKSIVAEASELGFKPGQVPYSRLYDDSADVGITLRNPDTGATTHWFCGEELKMDGEIVAWIFWPTAETLWKHLNLAGWQVHILND